MKFLNFVCRVAAVLVLFVAFVPNASAASGPSLAPEQQAWLAKARRFERHGWIYLHIEGAPRERGFQHGHLLAREIAEELRVRRAIWKHDTSMEWSWLVEKSATLYTPKVDAENLAEIDGMVEGMKAAGGDTTRDELIAYNGWFDLAWYWWPREIKNVKDGPAPAPPKQACSAFVATGRMTADGGVVLGHNTMFDFAEATARVILDLKPAAGHRILMQTFPGWLHSGTDFFVTDAGLVGAETTIGEFDGFDTNGVPEFVRFRRATQDAGSIDDWCAIMKRGNNGGYANAWLLGDVNSGEIARLELGLKHVALERTKNGFFIGSNVAEDLKILRLETSRSDIDIRTSSVARRERWKELMKRHAGRIDRKLARQFEADHHDTYLRRDRAGGRSLCGHFELDSQPFGNGIPFSPSGTFDAKIVDTAMAKRMSFEARWGSACGRGFDAPKFLAAHPQFDWLRDILKSRATQPWTTFRIGE